MEVTPSSRKSSAVSRRSTTWSILKGQHKSSGLSASVIIRILSAPRLPTNVREKIHEYVAEKSAGRYGNSKIRLREFAERLSHVVGPESESTNGKNNR
jgi:hypothetical protein